MYVQNITFFVANGDIIQYYMDVLCCLICWCISCRNSYGIISFCHHCYFIFVTLILILLIASCPFM